MIQEFFCAARSELLTRLLRKMNGKGASASRRLIAVRIYTSTFYFRARARNNLHRLRLPRGNSGNRRFTQLREEISHFTLQRLSALHEKGTINRLGALGIKSTLTRGNGV